MSKNVTLASRGGLGELLRRLSLVSMAGLLPMAVIAGPNYGPWQANVPVLDTSNSVAGGCPIESRDGRSVYTARRTPIGEDNDDLNIWVNSRDDLDSPYGAAFVLPAPINTEADEFCPTPLGGNYLLFVSSRPGGCGGGDIYIARRNPAQGWGEPVNLGCVSDGTGPNTAGGEFSPGIIETDEGTYLFFSSTGSGNHDLYMSRMRSDGSFGPGMPITELNTADDDRMPTLTKDGLEMVFSSDRLTWGGGMSANPSASDPSVKEQDVYYSSRRSLDDPWSDPVNLSVTVPLSTEPAGETRASFSWDRERVLYGSAGEVYVIERRKLRGRR